MKSLERSGSKRWTAQFKHTNEREVLIAKRIGRALRRIGFAVENIATYDRYGVRDCGAVLQANVDAYTMRLVVALPGHKLDELQLATLACDPLAVCVRSVPEALTLASVGIIRSER